MRAAPFAFAAMLAMSSQASAAPVSLGAWTFDSSLFGNTLLESDGGAFSSGNWLNTANADPGNPGYLTGANFNTGVANIGLGGSPQYTIGYGTPIANTAGNDLAIVSARYSLSDTFTITINGTTLNIGPASAQATGVNANYFYAGGGPFGAELFVSELDLSSFGVAPGGTINSIIITGAPEADLIRVAGFDGHAGDVTTTPEPASMALLGAGLLALAARRRR